jgi:2-keto-4-pentenoate hydratase/2-oxohepta-3-ene-1,7-dioic acid hydratase in catechol pathway
VRFATIRTTQGLRLHVKGSSGYVDLATSTGDDSLVSINGLIAGGAAALDAARSAAAGSGPEFTGKDFAPSTPNPPRILCLGVNYAEHAIEGGRAVPTWPESFVRGSGSVIGKGGRYIRAEDAFGAIFGYSVMNDGSAREWQHVATQMTPGKNFEGTMPIGPEVVTSDEVDVTDLAISSTLNGQVMQSARTSDMIVSVAKAVEFFSSFTTLRPGDVIATGTPGGVGYARTPPVWLLPGDTIEVTVEGIGTITNHVVAEEGAPTDWPWSPLGAKTSNL